MELKYKKTQSSLTVYLYGELDEYSAKSLKNVLDNLFEDNLNVKKVIFDLSGLSFMDSTGVGLLIGRYKKLNRFGIVALITGANVSVEKVIEISGLYKIMPKI